MSNINKTEVSELKLKIDEVIEMAQEEKRIILLLSANNEGKEAQFFIQGNYGDLVTFLVSVIELHPDLKELLEDAINESE
jgi:hypothetical protein